MGADDTAHIAVDAKLRIILQGGFGVGIEHLKPPALSRQQIRG